MADVKVLVVEDESDQRAIISSILARAGFAVCEAGTVDEAVEEIGREIPDLVLCDWRMPGRDGGELLKTIRDRGLSSAFIVMTAYGSIAHAVDAIRAGADDYLSKPFERDALLLAVQRVLRTRRLEEENRRLREVQLEGDRFGDIIGRAPLMQQLYRTIEKVASSDATVLILGESGTGKELAARTLHRASRRAGNAFVAVNCAAIPETLIESELFGHERGAFTGAHRRRDGKFAEAEGGTLFFDEIASMPLALQATLLRVLQERCFVRLGGRGEIPCDVRVLAASNRDLAAMVREGAFREDLYYRLNVVTIEMPALRNRREDIPLLVRELLQHARDRHAATSVAEQVGPSVLRVLMEHTWPGNVRELANAVERMVLLAEDGQLVVENLPAEIHSRTNADDCPFELAATGLDWDQMEIGLLRQALEMANRNCAQAARLLGLSYKTFLYRLHKHGLDGEEEV